MLVGSGITVAQKTRAIAPEIWSTPVKITKQRMGGDHEPCITPDGSRIYFSIGSALDYLVFSDTGWVGPVLVNKVINDGGLNEAPSLSPDGKTLFFRRYAGGYGGWDVWQSQWIDSLDEWGAPENLGPNINSNADELFCYTPDNKYLYVLRDSGGVTLVEVSQRSDSTLNWEPLKWLDLYCLQTGAGDFEGISMPANQKKMYFGAYTWVGGGADYEMFVAYKDTISGHWCNPMRLNINSHPPDSTGLNVARGLDLYPSVTPDGKLLFFESTRDTSDPSGGTPFSRLYMSRLLVDEHGDTVSVAEHSLLPDDITLEVYPSPTTESATIQFTIPDTRRIVLSLIDEKGALVMRLADSLFPPGCNRVTFPTHAQMSGVYYIQTISGRRMSVRSFVLIK